MEGESKTIACEARGKPTPSYRWTFQPKEGAVDTNTWPKDQQNIYLRNVDISNMGIYTCVASNSIRNVTHNMTKSITINIGKYTSLFYFFFFTRVYLFLQQPSNNATLFLHCSIL